MSTTLKPTYKDIFGGDSDSDDDDKDLELSDDSDDDEPRQLPVAEPESESEPEEKPLPKFKKREVDDSYEATLTSKPTKPRKKYKKRAPADEGGDQTGERKTTTKKKRAVEPVDDPDRPLNPEEARAKEVENDIKEALERIKPKKKRKDDGDDPEVDEMIIALLQRMKEAGYNDQESNRLQQPALAKITMLPSVIDQLSKTSQYEQMLDNSILDGMKLWLEPLPADGSLPNLDVQYALFSALAKMPIRTEHLKESKIGRVVMFYSKCDRVVPDIQKRVNELLEKWMRPILGRSKNYKDRAVNIRRMDYDVLRRDDDISHEEHRSSDNIKHTRVPKPVTIAFDVMPKSNLNWNKNEKGKAAPDNRYKKMKNRLQGLKKKDRAPVKLMS